MHQVKILVNGYVSDVIKFILKVKLWRRNGAQHQGDMHTQVDIFVCMYEL